MFRKLTKRLDIKRFLINWSPAIDLCMVASGNLEAVFIYENETYDFTAGKLIVREVGGTILLKNCRMDTDDLNNRFLACNAKRLSRKLLKVFP